MPHHHHHHHHHHRNDFFRAERGIERGLEMAFLANMFRQQRYDGYRGRYAYNRRGGCIVPIIIVSLIIFFTAIKFWWLVIPAIILGIIAFAAISRNKQNLFNANNNQPYNQPYNQQQQQYQAQAQAQYQEYNQGYQSSPQPYYQPSNQQQYQSNDQYSPQAQYPQNTPPMY